MPVNSTHLEYDANEFAWLRARDVLAGEDAVKLRFSMNCIHTGTGRAGRGMGTRESLHCSVSIPLSAVGRGFMRAGVFPGFFAPSSVALFTICHYSPTTPSVHAHYSLTATRRFGLSSQP